MARSRAPVWSPGHGWSPSPDHISLSPSLWDHEQEGGHQNPKERELSCLSADSEAGILLPTLHSQRDGTYRLVWPMSRTYFPRRVGMRAKLDNALGIVSTWSTGSIWGLLLLFLSTVTALGLAQWQAWDPLVQPLQVWWCQLQ